MQTRQVILKDVNKGVLDKRIEDNLSRGMILKDQGKHFDGVIHIYWASMQMNWSDQ